MIDYDVTLNYISENKEVKLRAPNIRFLKYMIDKIILYDNEIVHVAFSTKKGFYSKVTHQNWFYLRSR